MLGAEADVATSFMSYDCFEGSKRKLALGPRRVGRRSSIAVRRIDAFPGSSENYREWAHLAPPISAKSRGIADVNVVTEVVFFPRNREFISNGFLTKSKAGCVKCKIRLPKLPVQAWPRRLLRSIKPAIYDSSVAT
jgi:hypothetical protein